MTEDEQAAAIGKLVTEYHQQRRLVGCIRSEITTIALEMKRIGDAVIGDPPRPEALTTDRVREDWPLAQKVRELEAEQEKLTALEESLRECDLGDLIPKPPRPRRWDC